MKSSALLAGLAIIASTPLAFAQSTPHAKPIPHSVINDILDPKRADGFGDLRQITDAELDALMETYLADDTLQTEQPEWEPEPTEFEPRQSRGSNGFLRAIAAFFEAIGPLVGYLLIAVIAAAIIYGLYLMLGESVTFRRREKQKQTQPDISIAPDLRPEQAAAKALLEDADALAAQGRYAEAVHLLLFRSITDIQEKKQGAVPRSLTAREIGHLDSLPGRVRDALSPIIRIVERSFFGGRDVDQGGWQSARASYEDFAFGEAWA